MTGRGLSFAWGYAGSLSAARWVLLTSSLVQEGRSCQFDLAQQRQGLKGCLCFP